MKNIEDINPKRIMIFIILFSLILASLDSLLGQEVKPSLKGDTLFYNSNYALRYDVGFVNVNAFDLEEINCANSFDMRIGFLSRSNFTAYFGIHF